MDDGRRKVKKLEILLENVPVKIPQEWRGGRNMTIDRFSAPLNKKFKKGETDDVSFTSGGMRWHYKDSKITKVR